MVGSFLLCGDQNKEGLALKEALKKETHFTVRVIPLGPGAASAIVAAQPELVLLNPKATYLEAVTLYYELKKDVRVQEIPIVLLLDEAEMKTADLPSGIQEVLYRPLRASEAVARLKLVHKRAQKVDQKNLITRGKLTVDVERYEVRVGERKIELTYTEFELLKFLCANPGTVFTREVLLNKVWGYEYYGGTRTVDVHIRRLRSKIESKSSAFIETVRNIGYKFAVEE